MRLSLAYRNIPVTILQQPRFSFKTKKKKEREKKKKTTSLNHHRTEL